LKEEEKKNVNLNENRDYDKKNVWRHFSYYRDKSSILSLIYERSKSLENKMKVEIEELKLRSLLENEVDNSSKLNEKLIDNYKGGKKKELLYKKLQVLENNRKWRLTKNTCLIKGKIDLFKLSEDNSNISKVNIKEREDQLVIYSEDKKNTFNLLSEQGNNELKSELIDKQEIKEEKLLIYDWRNDDEFIKREALKGMIRTHNQMINEVYDYIWNAEKELMEESESDSEIDANYFLSRIKKDYKYGNAPLLENSFSSIETIGNIENSENNENNENNENKKIEIGIESVKPVTFKEEEGLVGNKMVKVKEEKDKLLLKRRELEEYLNIVKIAKPGYSSFTGEIINEYISPPLYDLDDLYNKSSFTSEMQHFQPRGKEDDPFLYVFRTGKLPKGISTPGICTLTFDANADPLTDEKPLEPKW
jgi:hypothetical protein